MLRIFTSSSSTTSDQAIDTPPLLGSALAQFFGAFTAIGAAVIAAYQVIAGVETTDPLKIALIGLVGLGIIAWAIAAAADTLARAFATAHVTRTESGKENQPALQAATYRLADAYAAAHGVKITAPANAPEVTGSAAPTSVYSPVSPASSKEIRLPISPPLKVKVQGNDAQAVAVLVSGESGKETQKYLIGLPGSPLDWVTSDAIYMPPASSPATSPAVQPPSTAASEECSLAPLSPPIRVKVRAKDGEAIAVKTRSEGGKETEWYLVGTPGSTYEWVLGDIVSMLPAALPTPNGPPDDAPPGATAG